MLHSEAGWLLAVRPYRDRRVLCEIWCAGQGRLVAVAQTGRRTAAHIQPLRPLHLSWRGHGEVQTLTAIEPDGPAPQLTGPALICALYLNELLIRLWPRHDPAVHLFALYVATVHSLAAGQDADAALRQFEKHLLAELGYGLQLDTDDTGQPLVAERDYCYDAERGPCRQGSGCTISGQALLALRDDRYDDANLRRPLRRLMRHVLAHHLGPRPLHTSRLWYTPTRTVCA